MRTIELHIKKDNKGIEIPITLEFEGSEASVTIWWYDDKKVRHSATVKESIKEIQQLTSLPKESES